MYFAVAADPGFGIYDAAVVLPPYLLDRLAHCIAHHLCTAARFVVEAERTRRTSVETAIDYWERAGALASRRSSNVSPI